MDIKHIDKIPVIKLKSINYGEAFISAYEENSRAYPCVRVHMPNKMEEIVLNNRPYILQGKDIFAVDLNNGNLFMAGGDTMVIPLRNSYFAVENT